LKAGKLCIKNISNKDDWMGLAREGEEEMERIILPFFFYV
jgi:hypothetical protein